MDQKRIVYIWDMDETLILLKSLMDGTYAEAYDGLKDVEIGVKLGRLWENHILQVCDRHFFYKQIEHFNQPRLDFLQKYDDGQDLANYDFKGDGLSPPLDADKTRKLSYRHRVIVEIYQKGLLNIMNQDFINLWRRLYELTDSYTEKWLTSARLCLELCAGQPTTNSDDAEYQNINILVTAGPLIPSLVKCLFFRLDKMITWRNVYSSLEVGKLQCFLWIQERFAAPNCQFCVIGNGWEECEAAQIMKWPFAQIVLHPNGIHRFPGLTPEDLRHYLAVVYKADTEESNDETGTSSSNGKSLSNAVTVVPN